jgi:restriction system protein
MPVPTYEQFIEPVLRCLVQYPDGVPARHVHDAAASALGLTQEDGLQPRPSGAQLIYKNRAGWAHHRLKRAGQDSEDRQRLLSRKFGSASLS